MKQQIQIAKGKDGEVTILFCRGSEVACMVVLGAADAHNFSNNLMQVAGGAKIASVAKLNHESKIGVQSANGSKV